MSDRKVLTINGVKLGTYKQEDQIGDGTVKMYQDFKPEEKHASLPSGNVRVNYETHMMTTHDSTGGTATQVGLKKILGLMGNSDESGEAGEDQPASAKEAIAQAEAAKKAAPLTAETVAKKA